MDTDITLTPKEHERLYEDGKIGGIHFSLAEKKQLLEMTKTKGWEVLTKVYAKQRLMQIAVDTLNLAQHTATLQYYKGMSAESNLFEQHVKRAINDLKTASSDE